MSIGYLQVTHRDTTTGEIISVYDDQQQITTQGNQKLVERLSRDNSSEDGTYFWDIHLGDDVGQFGTTLEPKPATAGYTSVNQNVVYVIDNSDIVITTPTDKSVQFYFNKSGADIIAEEMPASGNIKYSSATLRFFNGTTFSVERFPTVTISGNINIEITWTIIFGEIL